ncbi:MAG: cytochrome c oxidase subunit II [Ilumatobacter sp.]|jgi:cytochrome c oxidase subunit II|uniref:cytochrome c oxidase subunit II n=1 Tax=Ilumatobacter sp. TaxID=1967498 RepID=UPI00391C2827
MRPASVIEPRGPGAATIADLWWLMLGLGGTTFVAVVVVVVLAVRRRASAPNRDSSRYWMLWWGVALPVVVVGIVLVATIGAMRSTTGEAGTGADALRIEVTGHQWWWNVEYPASGVITANEVHIPAGQPVELSLRSADVIHSFWVPALAGKMDAIPERTNSLVIEASEPGRFEARCAEFCGLQHANMDLTVVAHDPDEFDAWIEHRRQPAREPSTPVERTGRRLLNGDGCAACHRIDGTSAKGMIGPDLTHVGARTSLAGGVLEVSRVDLIAWITDPHASKSGVLMPATELTDAEIAAIATYLESLT